MPAKKRLELSMPTIKQRDELLKFVRHEKERSQTLVEGARSPREARWARHKRKCFSQIEAILSREVNETK